MTSSQEMYQVYANKLPQLSEPNSKGRLFLELCQQQFWISVDKTCSA